MTNSTSTTELVTSHKRFQLCGEDMDVARVIKHLGLFVQTLPVAVRVDDKLVGVNDVRVSTAHDGRLVIEIVADVVRPAE